MTKKNKPSHTEAKKYLDTYTGKIRQKFLDQKKEKALFELLNISPEKPEEESIRMKEEMKKFVQELQSDKNYAAMKKIYHEQMKNIHSFNKLIHNYSQEIEKLKMKEHTNLAKEKFFNENIGVWKKFVKTFKEKWDSLTPQQQQTAFEDMDKLMNDPSAYKKSIKHIKNFGNDDYSLGSSLILWWIGVWFVNVPAWALCAFFWVMFLFSRFLLR